MEKKEKSKKSRKSGQGSGSNVPKDLKGERELIVIAKGEAGLRATKEGVASVEGTDVTSLAGLLESEGAVLQPLFGLSEERIRIRMAPPGVEMAPGIPDLSVFYQVKAPDERLEELAKRLLEEEVVDTAYIKPPVELPQILNDMMPSVEEAPSTTPNFTSRQGYLDVSPGGINAQYAWTLTGGSGSNVRIIDIEGAWRFSHEDLLQNQGGVVGGIQSPDIGWRNHGTAVIGEFSGDRNTFGITGICPDANVRAISIFGLGSSAAIRQAADMLNPGDIILIELHRPGPRFNFQQRPDQRGYIAIEWWPDDFAAIFYATSRGVIVVEAAGNGAENLDDAIYNTRPAGFPPDWTNPFNRSNRDSGAIVVGAGAPPPGTHGNNWGPDRSRLSFSNFGALIDSQGWGREVTTCGYGDLQGGANEDFWYTDQFSGTSSASPIVVGALGCIQGIVRAKGNTPLTPAQARELLRKTGSPQQDAPGIPATQRIGNRPDLNEMVKQLSPSKQIPLYRYWNSSATDHFYTTDWGELGYGKYGWKFESIQCYVYSSKQPGTVPLYRYWHSGAADHFYTTNWGELGYGKHGWKFERIECYVYSSNQPGTVPLFRYWNGGGADHFYTTNWGELGYGKYGWKFEGIQCYVFSKPSKGTAPIDETTSSFSEISTPTPMIPDTFRGEIETEPFEEAGMIPESFIAGSEIQPFEEASSFTPTDSFTVSDSSESFQISKNKRSGPVTVTVNVKPGNEA